MNALSSKADQAVINDDLLFKLHENKKSTHDLHICNMNKSIELFAGAGGLALGLEKAGFETLAFIEFDKDAAETLKVNRAHWNVINDDIENISCCNLKELFQLKRANWICYLEVPLANLFLMPERDLALKMHVALCFITMQYFFKNYSQKCFYLKMSVDYSRIIMGKHMRQ